MKNFGMKRKTWEETMEPWEVDFLYGEIREYVNQHGLYFADNFRAARCWVSSQRRRFRKIEAEGCCGSENWIVKRFNLKKMRVDKYMVGCNYGH